MYAILPWNSNVAPWYVPTTMRMDRKFSKVVELASLRIFTFALWRFRSDFDWNFGNLYVGFWSDRGFKDLRIWAFRVVKAVKRLVFCNLIRIIFLTSRFLSFFHSCFSFFFVESSILLSPLENKIFHWSLFSIFINHEFVILHAFQKSLRTNIGILSFSYKHRFWIFLLRILFLLLLLT